MEKAFPARSQEEWIAIFEAAAGQKGDELNDEWRWLLAQLGLPLDAYSAVCEVLSEGRWRTANNPKGYVKTAAKRVAKRFQPSEHGPVVLVNGPTAGDSRWITPWGSSITPTKLPKPCEEMMGFGDQEAARKDSRMNATTRMKRAIPFR